MNYKFMYLFSVIASFCYGSTEVERYAIISGVNDGGQNRQILRYAIDDAVDFSSVMFEMGGLSEKNTILLKEPSIKDFNNALHEMKVLLKADSTESRKELIVYYSGHADEQGLLFGNQCFDYKKLRTAIDSIGSDVKITILDACASGSITRIKGGTRKKAFLVDASSDLTGYAFITSSSELEASQESDKIKGSFFTHFLVSGLRGAADMSSDGKITLSEAYQFAFHETLAGTESSVNGPQHPSYDMRLTGSGDVVMTDIRNVNASIKFPPEISGRIFIRNSDNNLIAELMKQKGKNTEIGIPGGEITVQVSNKDGNYEVKYDIYNDTLITLSTIDLKKMPAENVLNQKKGSDSRDKRCDFIYGIKVKDSLVTRGVSLALLSNTSFDTMRGIQYSFFSNKTYKPFTGFQWSFWGRNYSKEPVNGTQMSLIFNKTESTLAGVQLSYIRNSAWKSVDGIQASAVINSCYDTFCGFQTGSISFTKNYFSGVSINSLGSVCNGNVRGVQIGSITSANQLKGVQISHICNISRAGESNGAQITGFFNNAANIKGVQIGLINRAAMVKGAQIGLINISDDMSGYPLGLFNYSKKGTFTLCVWHDEQRLTNFSLQSGTRNFYNIFTAAIASNHTRAAGIGMGYRIPFKYAVIENDINNYFTARHINDNYDTYDVTEKIRLNIGTRFIPFVSISGGISYNFLFNFDRKHNVELYPVSKNQFKRIDQGIYCWPGFHFGLSIGKF